MAFKWFVLGLTLLNTSTTRHDEIEQVLQTYHNNFGRVAAKFESIDASIVTLQSEINQHNAMVLRTEEIEFDQQSVMSQASNHSSASSGQLTFTGPSGVNLRKLLIGSRPKIIILWRCVFL